MNVSPTDRVPSIVPDSTAAPSVPKPPSSNASLSTTPVMSSSGDMSPVFSTTIEYVITTPAASTEPPAPPLSTSVTVLVIV